MANKAPNMGVMKKKMGPGDQNPKQPRKPLPKSGDRIKAGLDMHRAEDGFIANFVKKGLKNSTPAQGAKALAKKVGPKVKASKGARAISKGKKLLGFENGGVVKAESGLTTTGTQGSGSPRTGPVSLGSSSPGLSSGQGMSGPSPAAAQRQMAPMMPAMQASPGAQTPMSSGNMILAALQRMMEQSMARQQMFAQAQAQMGQQFFQPPNGGQQAPQVPQAAPMPAQAPMAPSMQGGNGGAQWLTGFNDRMGGMGANLPATYGV